MGNVCYKEIYYHKPKTQGRSLLRFQCFKCGDPNCVYGCGNYSDCPCRNHLLIKTEYVFIVTVQYKRKIWMLSCKKQGFFHFKIKNSIRIYRNILLLFCLTLLNQYCLQLNYGYNVFLKSLTLFNSSCFSLVRSN